MFTIMTCVSLLSRNFFASYGATEARELCRFVVPMWQTKYYFDRTKIHNTVNLQAVKRIGITQSVLNNEEDFGILHISPETTCLFACTCITPTLHKLNTCLWRNDKISNKEMARVFSDLQLWHQSNYNTTLALDIITDSEMRAW